MVVHRAIQIGDKYQNAFAPSMLPDLTHVVIIGVSSVLSMLSQAFVVLWDGKDCPCRESDVPYWILVSAYVGTFVRFGLTVIISPVIMCISCFKVVQWVRSTPAEKLLDTWNALAFPGTTDRQLAELRHPHGWMTASMCIVPLSINFVACSLYSRIYEFVCALGLCKMVLDSLTYRMGMLFLHVQLVFSPIIIAVYIPALRDPFARGLKRLLSRFYEKARKLFPNDAEYLQVA
ncbi:unnamed protein product [Dibothriocephalus latus]|uniref:Uncharacterized protein n=1 Tax=Dibothriocephalus latus TaxID=60516 RepID=A0A3P7P032_DIBLA|nr:unnamed protein product [Dibothriocephalus latus]